MGCALSGFPAWGGAAGGHVVCLSALRYSGLAVQTPIPKGDLLISITSKLAANPRPLCPLPGLFGTLL